MIEWLAGFHPPARTGTYAEALDAAVYDEAIRFDQAYRKRAPGLLPLEREYASRKLARAKALFYSGARYGYSAEGMREFFRDMIANVNGMYHVMTVNPGLLGRAPSR